MRSGRIVHGILFTFCFAGCAPEDAEIDPRDHDRTHWRNTNHRDDVLGPVNTGTAMGVDIPTVVVPTVTIPIANDCAPGLTPTYHDDVNPDTGPVYGASGIQAGPGGAPLRLECETTACTEGNFAVEFGGTVTCVPPPAFACAAGEYLGYVFPYPEYVAGTFGDSGYGGPGYGSGGDVGVGAPGFPSSGDPPDGSEEPPTDVDDGPPAADPDSTAELDALYGGHWVCKGACNEIVNMGGLAGNRIVCAGNSLEDIECDPAAVANTKTLNIITEEWECAPQCNNGLYDMAYQGDQLVCVPC